MKAELVQIGNSRGIRIPNPLIEQCGSGDKVELRIQKDCLVISPDRKPRQGWDKAFRAAGPAIHDELLLDRAEPSVFATRNGSGSPSSRRDEIWLVSLDPTQEVEIQKTRPCLVVSPEEMNQHLRTVVIAPMSAVCGPIPRECRYAFRENTTGSFGPTAGRRSATAPAEARKGGCEHRPSRLRYAHRNIQPRVLSTGVE